MLPLCPAWSPRYGFLPKGVGWCGSAVSASVTLASLLPPTTSPAHCPPTHVQGAPVLTNPLSGSPLLLALGQEEQLRSKHAEQQRQVEQQQEELRRVEQQAEDQGQEGQGAGQGVGQRLGSAARGEAGTQPQQAAQGQREAAAARVQDAVRQQQRAAQALRSAGQVVEEVLRGWKQEHLLQLLEAELAPPQRQLVSSFVEKHTATVLTPFIQASLILSGSVVRDGTPRAFELSSRREHASC